MRDFLLVAEILFACAIVGYPACLLLPAATFRARFVVAPTIGLAILSAGIACLYKLGVSPRHSLFVMGAAGLLATMAHVIRSRHKAPIFTPEVIDVAVAAAAVIALCLLPAWIGGPQFTVFQGNVYDQFFVYLPGSVEFHQYDYLTVMAAGGSENPVISGAKLALNRPISIIHAAFVGTHATATASSYAFTLALQINMFFSALFTALHVFEANNRTAILAASALTVGFFQQYVLDINAWAQLSTQSIYLLVAAIVVLAFDPFRFGTTPAEAIARLILFFAVLMAAATILYPDSCGVYGIAAGGAAFVGLIAKKPWHTKAIAFAGLGSATTLALSLSYWFGSLPFFASINVMGVERLGWWKYFQAYLLGRMDNHVDVLASGPPWSAFFKSLVLMPIEGIVAGIGLYWFLPTTSFPAPLRVVWWCILALFVCLLFANAARTTLATWKEGLESNSAKLLTACVASWITPVIFLFGGFYWLAGKSFSMAAPLLFFFIVAPLLTHTPIKPLARAVVMLFLVGHLVTGILRPVFAFDPIGTQLAGFPGSARQLEIQKAGMDWRMDRLAEQLKSCNGVILNIKHSFMNALAKLVAADLGIPWASVHPINLGYTVKPPYQPAGWERANCIASDNLSEMHSGRRVIWLISDRSTFDFLEAKSGELEIGVSGHPGIDIDGASPIEMVPSGRLRWTSGKAHFRIPNSPDAPATKLTMSLWPMSLSPGAQLQLLINDRVVFNGPVPSEPLAIALNPFAREKQLTIELKTTPITRYPGDPRDLGVALKQILLEKSD